jgi:hypothetical protein
MGIPVHVTLYQVYGEELSELLDIVLTGEVGGDWATAQRLVRTVGALVHMHQRHRLDDRGRCSLCWMPSRRWWRPWPKRSVCTVHTTIGFYLRQPTDFVLSTLTEY